MGGGSVPMLMADLSHIGGTDKISCDILRSSCQTLCDKGSDIKKIIYH